MNEYETVDKYVEDPIQINIGSSLKVVKLECGAGHTLILTQFNQMFSWGCNLLGQLGLGDNINR